MMLTWFEFVKPRLATQTMQRASAEFCKQYLPELYAEARLIAEETIARAETLPKPNEAFEVPDDVPFGIQIVAAIIEEKTLG